ncbi:MAG: CatB-related O-acetyltransferase [Fimbriimonas sp.]
MSWLAGNLPPGMNRIGENTFVHAKTLIFGPISLGPFTVVREGAFIVGASAITFGAFVDVGAGCHIVTHEQHMPFLPSTFIFSEVVGLPSTRGCGLMGLDAEKREVDPNPIRIGNDVSLGHRTTVMGGVTIGDGCVIRAQSLVNRDCEPYGVYEGVPARWVGWRFPPPVVEQLQALRWWEWSPERIVRNARFFAEDLSGFQGDLSELIVE